MEMPLSIAKVRSTPQRQNRPRPGPVLPPVSYCAVVDSRYAGQDAGEVLDGKICRHPGGGHHRRGHAIAEPVPGMPATHLVIGIAPDGGRLGKTPAGM
jgi:hypothetical protein